MANLYFLLYFLLETSVFEYFTLANLYFSDILNISLESHETFTGPTGLPSSP